MQSGEGARRIHQYSFRLDNLLGKGATGEVYLGENVNNGEKVACKIIDMAKIDNEVTEYLLNNEKKALTSVKHPNVIRTVDIFQEKDFCYIFTEFCNEGTLFDGIQLKGTFRESVGRLLEEQALQLFRQIVEGYRACIEKGIIHRDLKPANILMHNGVPLISDFGYCEIVGVPKPKIFYNVGSPSYMAPEAFVVNIYSEKSDVWSLGVVLYEMIVGRTFDGGGDIMEVISNLGKQGVPYPDHVSPYCRYVINQCLNLDPAKRINLKQLIQILDEKATLEKSEVIQQAPLQRPLEQPTVAQMAQRQRIATQQQVVARSQPQPQQKAGPNRSLKQPPPQQQIVVQPSLPQPPPQLIPVHNRQPNMHNILARQGQVIPNVAAQPHRVPPPIPHLNQTISQEQLHQMTRTQKFHLMEPSRENLNVMPRLPQQHQERIMGRASTHHVPSSTQIEQPINNPQEYQQLYEQALQRNVQGRENIMVPRLLSHHAILEDYNMTARSIKSEADELSMQRAQRVESEMLRKVPSLESNNFRGKSQYIPQGTVTSRGLPHKSERQLVIPTHERFASQQQNNFRPFSVQQGLARPATTMTAVNGSQQAPYPSLMVGKDNKLVRSMLINDANKHDIPVFTQIPFQRPPAFDPHSQMVKPETHYIPGYHPFNQRLPPEQTHIRTNVAQPPISPVSPVYPVGQFELPVSRPLPNHQPNFKKPAARISAEQPAMPIQTLGMGQQSTYPNTMTSPENRQQPILRGPSIRGNGLPPQRINRNAIQQQRVQQQQINPQFRPVR